MGKIRIATVFSGIGAIEFALKRMKLPNEIVFACDNGEREIEYDFDKEFATVKQLNNATEKQEYVEKLYNEKTNKKNYVQQTYLANYKCPKNRYFQDIRLLDGNDFKGQVDLFVGGSPCQSFSSVGFQGGLDDTRGTLFYEYARLIKEIEPKVFIYENVRNLINHDNGKTWKVIKKVFDSLGYTFYFDVLNAADFGIPQNRRRLFVVGFKDDKVFSFPNKEDTKYDMHQFLETNCSFNNFKNDLNGEIRIDNVPGKVDKCFILSPLLYKYVMCSGTKTFFQKPEINKPVARTILKTMGNRHRAGIDNYVSDDYSTDLGKVRMLTPREAHRLMGFTDDFNIVVSKSQAYKQAGNSIVVDVLIKILNQIFTKEGNLK